MSYDIWGNPLPRGNCEVHPHVHEEYPCSVCMAEKQQREQASQQSETDTTCREIDNLKSDRQELLAALGWIYHELREIKNRGPKTLNIDLDVIDIYRDFNMEIPDKESSTQAMNDFRIKHLGEGGK